MLDGITIIKQTEIIELPINISIFLTIIFIGFCAYIFGRLTEIIELQMGGMIIGIISFLLMLLSLLIIKPEPTGKYEYQVIIDESITFDEICEQYEVIEQNGLIWTIKDKD